MGHRSPSSPDLTCCWGGLPGLTRGTGAAARGRFGGPDSGGGFRRARRTAERRAAALGRRLLGGSTEWEASEYRLDSLPTKRMELIKAVRKEDSETVKVRRLPEAVSGTEYGPSRGVYLGLGQWTLDAVVARPIRPCCVESSPYVRHPSGNFDAACRRSSVPVWTSRSVTRTLPCRLAESHNFSPPPSPAIAVSATF